MGARFQYQGGVDPQQTAPPAPTLVGLQPEIPLRRAPLVPPWLPGHLLTPTPTPTQAVVLEPTPPLQFARVRTRDSGGVWVGTVTLPVPPVPHPGNGPPPDKGKGHDKPDRRTPAWNLTETGAYLSTQGQVGQFLPVGLTRLDPLILQTLPQWRTRQTPPSDLAAPIARPVVPFDPAQQVATLPQVPQRPPRLRPPSILLVPPMIEVDPVPALSWHFVWRDLPRPTPVRMANRPAFQFAPLPIPNVAAPALSWQPQLGRLPFAARRPTAAPSAFAPFPITIPAFLFSMWKGWAADNVLPTPFLRALAQSFGDPGFSDVAVVTFGTWRPSFPDWFRRIIAPPVSARPLLPQPSIIAVGVGCIMLVNSGVTESTLAAADGTSSTFGEPTLAASTLADPEIC